MVLFVYVCGVCVCVGVAELAPHDIWACGVEQEQEEETMVLVFAAGALGRSSYSGQSESF